MSVEGWGAEMCEVGETSLEWRGGLRRFGREIRKVSDASVAGAKFGQLRVPWDL
jgi:hypothetical protein